MIDPNIALGVQPAQIQSPMDAYAKALSLKNMMQQGQLGQQQLQAATLENQQRQIALAQTQALNKAYAQAITPGGADGSAPDIDTGKLTSALAASNAGAAIPGVLKGVNEFHQSAALLAKTRGEVAAQQTDAAGSLGLALQKADYDPRLFLTLAQHAVNMKAVDPSTITPATSQVALMLQQDPSGAQAKAAVQQLADNWVRLSPGAQKQLNEAKTAQGAADRGTGALGELAIKQALLPGQVQGQALANTKLAQDTTGTQPLSPYQSQDLKIKGTEAGATVANAATNRARLGVEQYNAGVDANGQPISYTDAQGNPVNVSPLATLIAQYKMPPVNARSYGSNRGLMNQVIAANPNFDIGQYEQRYKTMRDLAPSGSLGQQALALNTLVRHSDDMLDAADALSNGNLQAFNAAKQKIAQWTGSAAPTNFDQLKQYVAGETVKLIRGSAGSEADIQAAQQNINRANSPAQLAGALRTNFSVAGGKMQAFNAAVRVSSGNDKYTALDPGAAQILQKRGYDPNTLKPATAPAAGQPAAAGAVSVTDPNGGVHVFPNQAAANKFKQLAGIK